MSLLTSFQNQIETQLKKKFRVKINDNHSTMLSVKWGPDCTQLSMHRMFLKAPSNIMDELACYLKKEKRIISPVIKAYIEDNLKKLNYRKQVDRQKLYIQGNVYNLQTIYNELNKEYFDGELDLHITWFGKVHQRNRTRVTFGLYYDPLRLIKVHRILDTPSFPDYFIRYVVYHEMVHHVCPAYVDEKGISRIHSKEFKAMEQRFRHYDLAINWVKQHQHQLFT